ncbi:hypothetical protein W97_07777 [Coniosporium apollinis CBS 100218]|uniref:CCHC-type domain-containing protein n=1 Tax=Coniosporium apollinis (strain CBS 100218) TaxID=1168221 RepID=R7Z3B2_CONA1|nr:uncharacterized protein W97_07777 [Coniosporium apollinis CBS 100218]EON68519.1 hypothetical protein W97_07777 [Coniosporium apollinis CBS 100218]
MEESNDSRTASIGRKRARETEQPLALELSPEQQTTPNKRPRLAASALDSQPEPTPTSRASRPGRSPSMSDADPEDEGGVELVENAASRNMETDSAGASAQPSNVTGSGFIPLASVDESRSDDSLLSNVIIPDHARRTVAKKVPPSKQVHKITRRQKEAIRLSEGDHARKIFLNPPSSPNLDTDTERQRCIVLEVTSLAQPDDVKYSQNQRQSMQTQLLRYLARHIYGGLEAVYHCWKKTASEVVIRALLVYSTPDQANLATTIIHVTKINVFGTPPGPPKALPVTSSEPDEWHKFEKTEWKTYAEESKALVFSKLREGELQPEEYEGFSQESETIAPTQPRSQRPASTAKRASGSAQGLSPGNGRDGQPSIASTAPGKQPTTGRRSQSTQLMVNNGAVVVDPPESALTAINGLNGSTDGPTTADTVMDEAAVDGEPLWFADTRPSAVPRDASPLLIAEIPVKLFQVSAVERELQGRYWKIFNDHDTVRCMTCAAVGHTSDACPSRSCKHCLEVGDHFSSACPSVRKCRKCRERGHSETDCPSKLRCISADGLVCDLCHETGHFEENCCWLWRTFNVNAIPYSKKVGRLLVGCYNCGSDLHWGNDCPLHGRKKRFDVTTFSANEANKFILPVAQHAANVKAKRNMGISIKGRAEKDAITISDDDEQSTFLGKRVQPPPKRGKIRVNAPAPKGARKADRYQITPNDYDRRPVYDHPPPTSFHTRPRSRSPPRQRYDDYQNGYDSYQGRYEDHQGGGYRARSPLASSYGRGQSYQPPLPNEPVPPPRRDRYGSYDRGYQPPPPPEPVPAPRKALGSGARGRGRGRGRR